MKKYTDPDPLHGHGKAIPKPKQPNGNSHFIPFLNANPRHDMDTYAIGSDGRLIRRHLPINKRPSRRALKRQAA